MDYRGLIFEMIGRASELQLERLYYFIKSFLG